MNKFIMKSKLKLLKLFYVLMISILFQVSHEHYVLTTMTPKCKYVHNLYLKTFILLFILVGSFLS